MPHPVPPNMPEPPLVAARDRLDFYHSRATAVARDLDPAEAWDIIMAEPMPLLRWAFRIRDTLSAPFGVTPSGGFSGARGVAPVEGEMLDFFLVERYAPGLLVLTARDTHLDVMTAVTTGGGQVAITTSVVTHNLFGRVYMGPVAPAHGLIVRGMLARVRAGAAAVSP
ncbi:MAG: DUF2867 domain-containing protein [Pseudomonadota bacterium]